MAFRLLSWGLAGRTQQPVALDCGNQDVETKNILVLESARQTRDARDRADAGSVPQVQTRSGMRKTLSTWHAEPRALTSL